MNILMFIINFFLRPRKSNWLLITSVFFSWCAALLALGSFFTIEESAFFSFHWFNVGKLNMGLSFELSKFTCLVAMVVLFVSASVQTYSFHYMKREELVHKYFAYLNLFTIAMLSIVFGRNLLFIFFAWELMGVASYLLIGFWFKNELAIKASKKAFLANKLGDLGFLTAIILLLIDFKTLDLFQMIEDFPVWKSETSMLKFDVLGLLLFAGCIAKSAQFPLSVWLPDAMKGPTPASALIHAATMVAAGVFLMFLVFDLLSPNTLVFISFIGVLTAFYGAFVASAQKEMKKTLAYSTISQLGYMVLAIGTANPKAAIIHMVVHAFFKATLFLVSGHVIHEMELVVKSLNKKTTENRLNPNDMWSMGGLSRFMPITFAAYLLAMMAAIGAPFSTGLLSKDYILAGTVVWANQNISHLGNFAFVVPFFAFLTVGITCFYMTRQLILVFLGKPRFTINASPSIHTPKEAHPLLLIPIVLLSVFSLFLWLDPLSPFDMADSWLFGLLSLQNKAISLSEVSMHAIHLWVTLISLFILSVGGFLSYNIYSRRFDLEKTALFEFNTDKSWLKKLAYNGWYINQFYERTAFWLQTKSEFFQRFDVLFIDKNIDRFGKSNVVLANISHLMDRYLVDGSVNFIANMFSAFGRFNNKNVENQSQKALIFLVLTASLILISLVFFLS